LVFKIIYLHIKEKTDGCSKLLDLLSRTDRDFFRQDPDRTEHVQNENTSNLFKAKRFDLN